MADLGSKATDGRLSFTKYVTENKRFAEIEFEIEKGKSTVVYTKKGTNLIAGTKEFKAGTKIKITDTKIHEFGKMKMAAVQIGTVKGFIPINTIRKPTGGNGTQHEDEVVDAINAYILEAGKQKVISSRKSKELQQMMAELSKGFELTIERNGTTNNANMVFKSPNGKTIINKLNITFADTGGAKPQGKTNAFMNFGPYVSK